jgi:signal transduction histidine kinase
MSILIDALGEMNRIDGGRRKFTLLAFDLTEILEAAILALEEDVAGRHQELVVDFDPFLPFVLADRSAVLAVLTAIIDNASRYSPDEAIISVQVSYSADLARLEVVDMGAGISIEDQSQLFTPFFRSDDPIIREHIGWGLALALGKKVIEALGGTIGFNSTLGDGSIFFFTIPLAATDTNIE